MRETAAESLARLWFRKCCHELFQSASAAYFKVYVPLNWKGLFQTNYSKVHAWKVFMYFTDSLLSNSSNDFSSNAALCGVKVRTYSSYNYNLTVDLVYSDFCGLFFTARAPTGFWNVFQQGELYTCFVCFCSFFIHFIWKTVWKIVIFAAIVNCLRALFEALCHTDMPYSLFVCLSRFYCASNDIGHNMPCNW